LDPLILKKGVVNWVRKLKAENKEKEEEKEKAKRGLKKGE
jgi:hypothetical protein